MNWLLISIAIILALVAVATTAWLVFNLISSILSTTSGAPWVVLEDEVAHRMWAMAQPKPGETVMDIGCGDARHLISAVEKYGVKAIGLEIAPLPLGLAKLQVARKGLGQKVSIRNQSLAETDVENIDIIFLYLTPRLLQQFALSHLPKLSSNTRVVVARFPLPDVKPTVVDRSQKHSIYLYSGAT